AAAAVRPLGAYRHSSAEAGRVQLDRCRPAGRPNDRRADARAGGGRARAWRRRRPSHSLAEPADLGHRSGESRRRAGKNRSAANTTAAREKIEALGLAISTNPIRVGLVACTGNTGCKFAAADTKRHAEEIARWCETRVALDGPVNIHLTGCHHSCAQHFVSEI